MFTLIFGTLLASLAGGVVTGAAKERQRQARQEAMACREMVEEARAGKGDLHRYSPKEFRQKVGLFSDRELAMYLLSWRGSVERQLDQSSFSQVPETIREHLRDEFYHAVANGMGELDPQERQDVAALLTNVLGRAARSG